ncbi:hypothetical protein [Streptomyces zaehneri]|nr:hypothetical protein [Streptomyces sp. DSM 40713]
MMHLFVPMAAVEASSAAEAFGAATPRMAKAVRPAMTAIRLIVLT